MTQWKPGMPNYDHWMMGNPIQPKPWDLAHELWYWVSSEDEVDIPIPKDFILYRKYDRLNSALRLSAFFGMGK